MIYIITGISRGLGKAIAELCLQNGNSVIGIGRTNTIEHPNYSFIHCDLSDNSQIKSIDLPRFNEPVCLINNAGILGEVKRISDKSELDLQAILQINTIAPFELIRSIYSSINNVNSLTIVNISSGAANRAIPSWAAYCASKAALNMLSETFYREEIEKGNKLKVYAIAPGVVDTGMQEQIRATDEQHFSSVDNFVALKNDGKLFTAKEAASKLIRLLERPFDFSRESVVFDLREI